MKVKPLRDRVLVERIEVEEKTKSGLYIPDTAQEKTFEGRVLAVGDGKRLDSGVVVKPEIQVGDRILFMKYGGAEVRVDGKDILILEEGEILGIFE